MGTRLVQVPMDEDLRAKLDAVAQARMKPRAEIIREACHAYLGWLREEELDRVYVEGYSRIPEDPSWAQAQVDLLAEVLPPEDWSDWEKR